MRPTEPEFEGFRVFCESFGVHVIASRSSQNAWLPGPTPILFIQPGMSWTEKGAIAAWMVDKVMELRRDTA